MIKYNNNTINDWFFSTDNIIKVYRNNAICYYKIDSSSPSGQTPCYAVVEDISQYSETEFEDVFNKADNKWYKLNNLDEYEEYGVYGSGRTICSAASFTELTDIIAQSTTALTNHNITVTPAVGAFSKIRIDTTKSATTTSYTWATFTPTPSGSEVLGINMDNIGVMNGYGNNKNYVTDANGSQSFAHWVDDNNTIVEIDIAALSNNQASELYLLMYQENCNPAAFSFYMEAANCVTTYEGKLTIDDGYEYIYSGGSWVNVGEVSGSTTQTVWYDPPSSGDNANFNIGHYWGENYKMVWTVYLQGSYSNDTGSFWKNNSKSPIEFSFYNNGYYFDLHDPTSTTSPSVYSGDYSYRITRTSTLRNYVNGQVMDITLTYGSVKIELVDSGTTIESTGSTRTGYSWYDGLYEPSVFLQSTNKVHVSRIQVYNASNVLVNDLTFVKNNGVTGSQEISMYDSVLNVTYNNTNSNTPTYHIVEESGDTEYPIYYDEIQDPPNNVTFTSMTEAESYECPYVGMIARIDGVRYIFSGDSQSGYEWVVYSRLPQGYTEVEYIQNTGFSYINTDFMPNTNTRVVVDMQLVTTSEFPRLFGVGTWNATTGLHVAYEGGYLRIIWFTKTSWTITNIPTSYDRRTIDLDKNKLYVNGTQVASTTYSSLTQATQKLALFTHINNGQPAPQELKRYFQGKLYSAQLYDNGTMIRNYVPCINPNNVVGLYDLVNDVFYTAPSEFTTDTFVAGDPV